MNRVLARLTARQLLGSRRTLIAAAVMLLPLVIAAAYLLFADDTDALDDTLFAVGLNDGLMLEVLVPIMALVLGTAVLGSEIEDGTAVFLFTKPVDRRRILAVKTTMAAACCALLVLPASLLTTWLLVGSPVRDGLMLGLGLTVLVAAAVYTVVFVALSAVTHRSLIFGLAYVFLWEALVTGLFTGLSWVSISEYAYGWGSVFMSSTEPMAGLDAAHGSEANPYDPSFGLLPSVVGTLVVLAGAAWLGGERLSRFQIGERK